MTGLFSLSQFDLSRRTCLTYSSGCTACLRIALQQAMGFHGLDARMHTKSDIKKYYIIGVTQQDQQLSHQDLTRISYGMSKDGAFEMPLNILLHMI